MGSEYNSLLNSVNFHNPSWDAFIFFFWIVASLIYSFSAGRGRIISILVAVYMGELLTIQAPFLTKAIVERGNVDLYFAQLIIFLVSFAFFFWVLSKFVFRTSFDGRRGGGVIFSTIFSFLQVGFLISVVLSFLPPSIKENFAPLIKFVFVTPTAAFVWLLLPIIFLMLIGRHISDRSE